MFVSEITLADIKAHLRIDGTDDDFQLTAYLSAAKSYLKNYTGLDDEKVSTIEELSIAVLLLVAEFYENRNGTVQNNTKVNMVLDSILSMHSINLL